MARAPYVYSSDEFWVYEGEDVVGDDYELTGNSRGGADTFYGEDGTDYGYWVYGDAYVIEGPARGGNDTFYGGEDVGDGDPYDVLYGGEDIAFFGGDADIMFGSSFGGNDSMEGGSNSSTALFGDAVSMYERAIAGNDAIVGSSADGYYSSESASNLLIGDAYSFGDGYGGPRLVVEEDGYGQTRVAGGKDNITGGDAYAFESETYVFNMMMGDAYSMAEGSKGGVDSVTGGSAWATSAYAGAMNLMAGDGYLMGDTAKGANDWINGGSANAALGGEAYAMNVGVGDGYAMFGRITSGNDTISGGDASVDGYGDAETMNLLVGDTFMYMGPVSFGNDRIIGGSGIQGEDSGEVMNAMYGDVGDLDALGGEDIVGRIDLGGFFDREDELPAVTTRMGNDVLIGGQGNAYNLMVGDAPELEGAKGGNDTLTAGGEDTINIMVGDADYMGEDAIGGRDVLIAGQGEDAMWGDARYSNDGVGGADTFVLSAGWGTDYIYDFSVSQRDKIDLKAFAGEDGFGSFTALSARMSQEEGGVYIDLSTEDVEGGVFLAGIYLEELNARCFVF